MLKSVLNAGTLRLLFPACDVLRKMARDANEGCDPSIVLCPGFFFNVFQSQIWRFCPDTSLRTHLFSYKIWFKSIRNIFELNSIIQPIKSDQLEKLFSWTKQRWCPAHHSTIFQATTVAFKGVVATTSVAKNWKLEVVFWKNLVKSLDYIIRKH